MTKYHLTYKDNKWKLKPEGAGRAVKTFETKKEAIKGSTDYLKAKAGSLRIDPQEGRNHPGGADVSAVGEPGLEPRIVGQLMAALLAPGYSKSRKKLRSWQHNRKGRNPLWPAGRRGQKVSTSPAFQWGPRHSQLAQLHTIPRVLEGEKREP